MTPLETYLRLIEEEPEIFSEEEKGFLHQLKQGALRSASFNYAGENTPENMPLTGHIGRIAGDIFGFAPAAIAGGAIGAGAGLGLLGSEALTGGLYGFLRKPEEDEIRMRNAVKDAALFAGGGAVLRGLGRGAIGLGRKIFGKGAKGIEAAIPETPAELEKMVLGTEETVPHAPPGMPFGAPEEAAPFTMPSIEQNPFLASPEIMEKAVQVEGYEQLVNAWTKGILKGVPKETEFLDSALKLDNLDKATESMVKDSVLHNLGETPAKLKPMEELIPKLDYQLSLQKSVDEVVTKNKLSLDDIKVASSVEEPVNFLMSKGVNFDDATEIVDKVVERAKTPFIPDEGMDFALKGETPELKISVAPKYSLGALEAHPPIPTPNWETTKNMEFSPEEAMDLFFNLPLTARKALNHNLLELKPGRDGLSLTEGGYAFLKKFNPDFHLPLEQPIEGLPNISRRQLGAIRGQGYSNLDLTPVDLKEMGFNMGIKNGLSKGFLRPGKIEGTFQLESKGAGMLAGGKGLNANVGVKMYDVGAGRRFAPGETDKIAAAAAENIKVSERLKPLLEDMKAQLEALKKGCLE